MSYITYSNTHGRMFIGLVHFGKTLSRMYTGRIKKR